MKAFISYDFGDNSLRGEVQGWLESAGHRVTAVQEKSLSPESDESGKRRIKQQISECDHVLVLVGNNTHNRPWVDYEVAVYRSKGIPISWVRLPNRFGAAPKEVRGLTQVEYSRHAINTSV